MPDSQDIEVIVTPGAVQDVIVTYAPPLVVTTGQPTSVNTVSTSTELVSVEELGIVGPPGPQGPAGTGAPQVFQLVAVGSWTWTHDFSYLPEVRLVDDNNEEVEIGVDYPDAHTVSLTFPQPFTGIVYLS